MVWVPVVRSEVTQKVTSNVGYSMPANPLTDEVETPVFT